MITQTDIHIITHIYACAHKQTDRQTWTQLRDWSDITHVSARSRHSGFSSLKKSPEFEFTVRDYLCLCFSYMVW